MDTFKLKTFLAEETKSPQVVLVQLKITYILDSLYLYILCRVGGR